MNQEQIEYLSKKIVQIVNHIEKQMDDKKAMLMGFNNEIKDSKKRLTIYSKAVAAESIEPLHEIMGEFEINEFEKIGR